MAYLKPIHTPKCVRCHKAAVATAMTWRNEATSDYCAVHGAEALARLKAFEAQEFGRTLAEPRTAHGEQR